MTINRDRGYNFEVKTIVKNLNFISAREQWHARRLGGSSTGLPDVVAVNNHHGILFAIEAKSIVSDSVSVPEDEFFRCKNICDMFKLYDNRYIVLAFKFGADLKNKDKIYKLNKGKTGIKKKRTRKEIKEYYFVIRFHVDSINLDHIRCNYRGELKIFKKKNTDLRIPRFSYYKFESIEEMRYASTIGFSSSHLEYC